MSAHVHGGGGCCGPGIPLLRCERLVVGYNRRPLLPPIDFTIEHGQLCAVVGRNGAGKTTWFRTLMGLLPPISGLLATCQRDAPMAYIPQRAALDTLVPLPCWDVVAMGLERGRSFLRPWLPRAARRKVDHALSQMGAAELAQAPFRELSEGQKQRVLMARLLVSDPELVVLDEPTAAMDQVAEQETMARIDALRREHELAVMIVSHHLPVVSRFADQIVFIDKDSQQVVTGLPTQVFAHPAFRARYGEEVVSSKPEAADTEVPRG
jgi:manganese/iron transport system ATP-binding protein